MFGMKGLMGLGLMAPTCAGGAVNFGHVPAAAALAVAPAPAPFRFERFFRVVFFPVPALLFLTVLPAFAFAGGSGKKRYMGCTSSITLSIVCSSATNPNFSCLKYSVILNLMTRDDVFCKFFYDACHLPMMLNVVHSFCVSNLKSFSRYK